MMKIKLSQIEALNVVLGELLTKELPIKTSYQLSTFLRKDFDTEYKTFNEKRVGICEKYCIKDADNKPVIEKDSYKFDDENKTPFYNELAQLFEVEVELKWNPIKIEELGNITIKPDYVNFLSDIQFIIGG
jgi:hypothetical protein